MYLASDWKDYELINSGDGEKYERWGSVRLLRPEPQAAWPFEGSAPCDAHYIRSNSGGGHWEYKRSLPESWTIEYKDLRFIVRPTGFKHTGLFPEQAANWDWFSGLIKGSKRQDIKVLNLFAYTGGATVAALSAGASVCHVDAAKGMVAWAKENVKASGLAERPVRFIVDDVKKFVEREIRRGHKYDGIIMDPPSYGRGPSGEVWKIEDELFGLIELCRRVMSDNPLFFLVNSYTTGLSGSVMENIYKLTLKRDFGGTTQTDEVGLPVTQGNLTLPCGYSARWSRE